MNNEELYAAAEHAIDRLFSDMSVPSSKCKENLRSLQGKIEIILEALESDEAACES